MSPDRDRLAPVERLLARDSLLTGLALAGAILLSWLWLLRAGAAMAMPGADPAGYFAATFLMWGLMMVAMMLPSATPMILLHARLVRRSGTGGAALTGIFALAYLAVWAGFSLAAAAIQLALVEAGAVPAMTLALGDRRVAGLLLLLAAAWQSSPLKAACLTACRSPVEFLVRHGRPGPAGAARLGVVHGLYCLGCCWALMLLLFVFGVMNLAWVALLALVVLAEKAAPAGWPVRRAVAVALALSGVALLVNWGQ